MQGRTKLSTPAAPGGQLVKASAAERSQSSNASLVKEQRADALQDLQLGLERWPLWFTIGWLEIKQRYRRSLIGPFWITLSIAIFVAGLGIVYSSLFHMPIRDYLPFLATGVIVWTLLQSLILEGCTVFIASEGAIKQNPVPLSVHVYRLIWRNLIIFGHNLIIYVLMLFIFPIHVGVSILLLPVGVLLTVLTGLGSALAFGILSARFRDVPLIVSNLVQVLFFVTPIFWRPDSIPRDRQWVVEFNPINSLIEIQRDALLGTVPPLSAFVVAGAFTALSLMCGVVLFVVFRKRIAYWL